MSFLGLFLFKDVISLGVSFYLISYFGQKAILSEMRQAGQKVQGEMEHGISNRRSEREQKILQDVGAKAKQANLHRERKKLRSLRSAIIHSSPIEKRDHRAESSLTSFFYLMTGVVLRR